MDNQRLTRRQAALLNQQKERMANLKERMNRVIQIAPVSAAPETRVIGHLEVVKTMEKQTTLQGEVRDRVTSIVPPASVQPDFFSKKELDSPVHKDKDLEKFGEMIASTKIAENNQRIFDAIKSAEARGEVFVPGAATKVNTLPQQQNQPLPKQTERRKAKNAANKARFEQLKVCEKMKVQPPPLQQQKKEWYEQPTILMEGVEELKDKFPETFGSYPDSKEIRYQRFCKIEDAKEIPRGDIYDGSVSSLNSSLYGFQKQEAPNRPPEEILELDYVRSDDFNIQSMDHMDFIYEKIVGVTTHQQYVSKRRIPDAERKDYWVGEEILAREPYWLVNRLGIKDVTAYLGLPRYGKEGSRFNRGPFCIDTPLKFKYTELPEPVKENSSYALVVSKGAPYHVGVVSKWHHQRVRPLCKNCLAPLYEKDAAKHHRGCPLSQGQEPGILNLYDRGLEELLAINEISQTWQNWQAALFGGLGMNLNSRTHRNNAARAQQMERSDQAQFGDGQIYTSDVKMSEEKSVSSVFSVVDSNVGQGCLVGAQLSDSESGPPNVDNRELSQSSVDVVMDDQARVARVMVLEPIPGVEQTLEKMIEGWTCEFRSDQIAPQKILPPDVIHCHGIEPSDQEEQEVEIDLGDWAPKQELENAFARIEKIQKMNEELLQVIAEQTAIIVKLSSGNSQIPSHSDEKEQLKKENEQLKALVAHYEKKEPVQTKYQKELMEAVSIDLPQEKIDFVLYWGDEDNKEWEEVLPQPSKNSVVGRIQKFYKEQAQMVATKKAELEKENAIRRYRERRLYALKKKAAIRDKREKETKKIKEEKEQKMQSYRELIAPLSKIEHEVWMENLKQKIEVKEKALEASIEYMKLKAQIDKMAFQNVTSLSHKRVSFQL